MNDFLKTARFFIALLGLSLKASVARRAAFALQVAFMAINNLIFFTFWALLFERVPSVRGYTLGDVALLFGVVAAGFGLVQTFAGGIRQLGRAIESGDLDAFLPQPKPTLLYLLGVRSQASGIGDALSGIALILIWGEPSSALLPPLALAILFSALVFASAGITFFSVSFWLLRGDALARQAWELLVTFALYPEPLFGGPIRLLLFTALPAGFVGYLPVRFVREPSLAGFALLALGSLAYGAVALVTFRRGLRRYASGSRFSVLG